VSKTFVVRVLAALLAFASMAANAAGLGELHVLSALGQPLRAEIAIVALKSGEKDSLSVRLASSEAFRQAGIEFNPALIGVKMAIQRRDGKPVVAISTREPVNEPFVEMLVELEWASGRLVREYTLLLDPPTYIPPPPAGAVSGPTPPAVAAPTQAIVPATPSEPAAPSAQAPAMTGGVDYEVAKGDTLAKIAREHMHAGVTFNQMMVAIYRANQDAFIRDNLNLVRAGRILRIPDRDAVATVGPEDARDTVLAHMASFAEYRREIAARAPTAPAGEGTRTAEGQISAPGGAAAPDATKDQLKLSRAEPGKPGGTAAASGDDRVARDRELKEAQSRVEELEKNVTDLQKLLEIKNQQVAELEKRAAQPMAVPAPKPAAEAPKPAAEAPKPAAETPKPAPVAPKPTAEAPPKPKPAPIKPAAKPRPVPPAPEPSFVDEYLGDPLMIGGIGAVILLLIGYGSYAWKKKKRSAQSQLGDDLLGVAAGGAAGAATGAAAASAAIGGEAVPGAEAEEVDPLAEADVYMAYGRDAQAEEILREALQKDASRPAVHSKLLEIYAKQRDAKRFEEGALKLKALVNGEGPEWDKTMALGRAIDPGNRLYGEGAAAAAAPEINTPEAPVLDFDIAATASGMHRASPDVTLDFDLGGTTTEAPVPESEAAAPASPDITGGRLDFDLGTSTTEKSSVAEEPAAAPDTGGGLDFELSLEGDEAPAEPERAGGPDLASISLDLGDGEGPGAAGGGDAKWQEVATKLDLAKAYEEMGDKDGARELLSEVVKEGDAAQQAQAQQLLASLG